MEAVVSAHIAPPVVEPVKIRNVAGLLRGSDPRLKDSYIMVTGHYDHLGVQNGHLYPGANDNGSGSVAVVELARMFARDGARPRRSIVFAVFGSEEQLMLGSFWYTAHPVRPLAGTRAVLNLDMIGRDEADGAQNLIDLVGTFYSPDLLAPGGNWRIFPAGGSGRKELSLGRCRLGCRTSADFVVDRRD